MIQGKLTIVPGRKKNENDWKLEDKIRKNWLTFTLPQPVAYILCPLLNFLQIIWKSAIASTELHVFQQLMWNKCYFDFTDLKMQDTGSYTCKAISETGETTWEAFLTVASECSNNDSERFLLQ